MKVLQGVTITMLVMGSLLASAVPGITAPGTDTETAPPQVERDTSGKSTGTTLKNARVKKKRGASSTGEATSGKPQPRSQDSHESTPGTTLMFRPDGSRVAGETTAK